MKKTRNTLLTSALLSAAVAMQSKSVVQSMTQIETPVYGPPPAGIGDINEDGNINIVDFLLEKKMVLEAENTGIYFADINKDGVLTAEDIMIFRKYLFGQVQDLENYADGNNNPDVSVTSMTDQIPQPEYGTIPVTQPVYGTFPAVTTEIEQPVYGTFPAVTTEIEQPVYGTFPVITQIEQPVYGTYPTVTVTEPAPTVTVTDSYPDVTVTDDYPEVTTNTVANQIHSSSPSTGIPQQVYEEPVMPSLNYHSPAEPQHETEENSEVR